jgi:hypothetical protein
MMNIIQLSGSARSLVVRVGASYRRSEYDDPDPIVDPTKAREDNRFDLEAGVDYPLARNLTLELRGEQSWNTANLPNYEFKNSVASLGLSFRF